MRCGPAAGWIDALDPAIHPWFIFVVEPKEVGRRVLEMARALALKAPDTGRFLFELGAGWARPASPSPSGLVVEQISDDRGFAALEDSWASLSRASGAIASANASLPVSLNAFTTWPWLYSWWMEIGRPEGHRLDLRVVRAAGSGALLGIAPCYVQAGPTAVLRMLGDAWVGSEDLDVLATPEHRAAVAEAVLASVCQDPRIDAADLVDLAPSSPLAVASTGMLAPESGPMNQLPYLPLAGSYDRYLATLSGNMRSNLRRKDRRLEKAYPQTRLVLIDAERDLPDALETLFRLHTRRWTARGQTGNFARPEVRAFHRRAAPKLLRSGVLRLYALELTPGQVVATLYCLRQGTREQYLQGGMDPSYQDLSVGFCLMGRVIKRAADEGVAEFDMLRGTEGYKAHWATEVRTTRRLSFARPTPRGVAWAAVRRVAGDVRSTAKDALGQELWAELKGRLQPSAGGSDEEAVDRGGG